MTQRFPRLRDLTRDWRFRTLMPIVLIHLVAFAALYVVMYRFAVSNLINTQKVGAAVLVEELQLNFDNTGNHAADTLRARLSKQAATHSLATLNVYDREGQPIVSAAAPVTRAEQMEVRELLAYPHHQTIWLTRDDDNKLLGLRLLQNEHQCQGCHGTSAAPLGVIQMGMNLAQPLAAAKSRVLSKFGIVGVSWILLVAMTAWFRAVVIGRPLAHIEQTISAAASDDDKPQGHDLGALAHRLDTTIWSLIEGQRRREADMARQMVRAEQLAALGELAAGLTHEIKNPVAGVIAVLELLQSDNGEAISNKEVCEQMLSELRRVTTTLDSLLRLARPRPPQRSDVDMQRVAREVATLFGARLRRQGVTLDIELAGTVPTLPLDSTLMVQLLVNLLTNSMQATDRGGSVRLFVAPFPHHDGVVLAVSDTGRGIAPDQLQRVFDPFFTTKEEGTGLGLAICRQIVEQHGGTISVESELGRGTRVLVLLPHPAAEKERSLDGAVAAG